MSTLTLETADGCQAFQPGEEIEVVADWSLDDQADAVELRLIWYTRGKGETDFALVQTERFEHPALVETRRVRLALPESPYSFSGKLVSLIWALELVVLPSKESTRVDITIAPSAREILLHGSGEG